MSELAAAVTIAAVVAGTGISAIGVLGYVRLPDVYTRLHAVSKVGIYGVVLLLVAASVWTPLGIGKAAVFILMLMVAAPSLGHTLASAAYRIGESPVIAERDDLDARSE
jgi:multicomponent Na+:H+ antiporter subunit G